MHSVYVRFYTNEVYYYHYYYDYYYYYYYHDGHCWEMVPVMHSQEFF